MEKVYLDNEEDLCKKSIERAYKKGLNEAWECAKMIEDTPFYELSDIFNDIEKEIKEKGCKVILNFYSVSEAIAKIEEYEEKMNQIELKVGDEIKSLGLKGIITRVNANNNIVFVLWEDGTFSLKRKDQCQKIKTGKSFPQIIEAMDQLKIEGEE